MVKMLQSHTRVREPIINSALAGGMGWGALGGLVGTIAMDVVCMGVMAAGRLPALISFVTIGDTAARFFSLLGIQLAGGLPLGMAAHYVIGPLLGAIFGAVVAQVKIFRAGTLGKGTVVGILFVEIVSQPMLAAAPILLRMTGAQVLLWFGVSFVMHMIFGAILGAAVSYGLRPRRADQQLAR